jgi:hypothetical protein
MNIEKPFKLEAHCNDSIKQLLQKTTLGTNGAKYVHLNTSEIIEDLDNPLFFQLERNDKVIGNITFCQRGNFWYIRYFAFDQIFQSSKSKNKTKNSSLKNQIKAVFDQPQINFYAYIDPKNERSKMMSNQFGFEKIGSLTTLTFSRIKPKLSNNLIEISDKNEINQLHSTFKDEQFYSEQEIKRAKTYALVNENSNIIASARVQKAHWEIKRLPGKMGSLLVKIIPFIPVLNQFLKPKNHQFLVVDCVSAQDEKSLNSLFESILAVEKHKLIFWWIDEKNDLLRFKNKVKWGIFSRFIGNPKVDVVAKINDKNSIDLKKTFFVSGIDLI